MFLSKENLQESHWSFAQVASTCFKCCCSFLLHRWAHSIYVQAYCCCGFFSACSIKVLFVFSQRPVAYDGIHSDSKLDLLRITQISW